MQGTGNFTKYRMRGPAQTFVLLSVVQLFVTVLKCCGILKKNIFKKSTILKK